LKNLWILTLLIAICVTGSMSVIACGDDDDDDDDDDTADVDDDDDADDDDADDDVDDDMDDDMDDDVDDDVDDDADDDDDSCADVVQALIDYCPEYDYDTWYQSVCVEYQDPDCLAWCYNAYDECIDIQDCYETDECLV